MMANVMTSFCQSELRNLVPFKIPIGTSEQLAKKIIAKDRNMSMQSSTTKDGIKTITYKDTWYSFRNHMLYLTIEKGLVKEVMWSNEFEYFSDDVANDYNAIMTYLEETYQEADYENNSNSSGLISASGRSERYYIYYRDEDYGAILGYSGFQSGSILLNLLAETNGYCMVYLKFCSSTIVSKKIQEIKNAEKQKLEQEKVDKFNSYVERARNYAKENRYEKALQEYQEALAFWPEKSSEYNEEIEKCRQDQALAIERNKQNNFTSLICSAREKRDAGDYTSAITKYNAAIDIYPNREKDYLSEINECKSINFSKYGDIALDNHQYATARRNYNDALELTTTKTQEITKKLALVDQVESLDNERKDTVYNYRLVNATNYQNTKKELSDLVLEYAKKNDIQPCTITVIYHHSLRGNETKEISVSPNDYSLKSYLERNVPSLPVHKTFGLILATEAIFQIPVESVKTTTHTAKRNYKEIKTTEPLRTGIRSQMNKPGRYTIGYTTVCIDGMYNSFQKMLSYRNTGGATNALLSVVVPGLGQHKVTYGEKTGIGTTLGVYGTIAAGVGFHLYSQSEYDKYHQATSQDNMDEHFKNAQDYQVMSYLFWGGAAIWWIYDVVDVYLQGKKNTDKYSNGRAFVSYFPQNNGFGIGYTLNF